jgi:hypothetical protein
MQCCRVNKVNIGFGCGGWGWGWPGLHSLPLPLPLSGAQGPGSTILFLPLWVWRHEPDLDPELAKRIFVRWVRVAAAATHNTSLSTSFLVAQSSIPPLRTSTQGVISTSLSYLPLEAQPTPLSTHSPTTVRRCYRSANNHRLGTPPPRTHPDYLHLSHSALPDRADQIRSRDTRTTT